MEAALAAGYHVFAGDRSVETNEQPGEQDNLTRLHLDKPIPPQLLRGEQQQG